MAQRLALVRCAVQSGLPPKHFSCAGKGEFRAERDIVAQVLAVLDRGEVVTARNRLERQYGIAPLPVDWKCAAAQPCLRPADCR
jgi:hypothetical protein